MTGLQRAWTLRWMSAGPQANKLRVQKELLTDSEKWLMAGPGHFLLRGRIPVRAEQFQIIVQLLTRSNVTAGPELPAVGKEMIRVGILC